jgi:polysaccharide biosynthesis transport protein
VLNASEVTLRDRLGVLRRRLGTILAVTGAAVAVAVGASAVQSPVYEADARLLLQPRATEDIFNQNANVRLDPARAVRNEIEVLKSEAVRAAVREAVGQAPTVSAAPVGDTDVVAVRARSGDPQVAARVANAYADSYIAFRRRQALEDLEVAGREVREKVDDLARQIDAIDAEVAAAPAPERDVLRASRTPERQALVSTQALFRQRLDQIQVETSLKSGGAQVVAQARPPERPVSPRPARNGALALVLGGGLGICVAFLRDHLDDTLKTKEDLEGASGGLPTVGLVPQVASAKGAAPAIVSLEQPSSPAAEAYRTLRTSLQFLSLDRPVRTLMLTSPNAGEGKTTTIANLGVVFARAGVKVVIVGCDLRRPKVHELFGLSNTVGLTSVLLGEASVADALQAVPASKYLRVLASGPLPPNPSELLSLKRTADIIESLSADRTIVLVDSPPVLPVTDALVLARHADACIMVCAAGTTTQSEMSRAVELLQQVDAPLVGAILNGVRNGAGYGYGYGGYGYGRPYTSDEPASTSRPLGAFAPRRSR